MMKQISVLLILGAIVLSPSRRLHAEEQIEGKKLYQTYCTGCHGISGKGDGPAAKTLPVKPADHTRARDEQTHRSVPPRSYLKRRGQRR